MLPLLAFHIPFADQSIVLLAIGVLALGVPVAIGIGLWLAFRPRR